MNAYDDLKEDLKIDSIKKNTNTNNARSRSRTCEHLRESILSRSPLTTWVFSRGCEIACGTDAKRETVKTLE